MTKSIRTALLLSGSLAFLAGAALAHTPLCACYDNGDGTVLCEGGFSDGSSAANVPMIVRDAAGETLLEGVIDANGEFEFEKPEGFHDVLFDAGEGHQIIVPQDEIY
ncbi:MAG: hypothetical protein ACK5JR_19420 [Tropicimonas sp.]|uniref:hypothetical protein n=1 Tax=Tropicimonas sp. TaxID=2067044 RepID=UPI003A8C08B5